MSQLDASRQAEIIAEEHFRASVRGRIEQRAVQASPPNFWGGFLLECLVIGLGFLFIGEVITGVIWFVVALAVMMGLASNLWPFLVIASLVHYQVLHARKYNTPPVWNGALWPLTLLAALAALVSPLFFK